MRFVRALVRVCGATAVASPLSVGATRARTFNGTIRERARKKCPCEASSLASLRVAGAGAGRLGPRKASRGHAGRPAAAWARPCGCPHAGPREGASGAQAWRRRPKRPPSLLGSARPGPAQPVSFPAAQLACHWRLASVWRRALGPWNAPSAAPLRHRARPSRDCGAGARLRLRLRLRRSWPWPWSWRLRARREPTAVSVVAGGRPLGPRRLTSQALPPPSDRQARAAGPLRHARPSCRCVVPQARH